MAQIKTDNPDLLALKGKHLWHAPLSSCSQRVRIVLAETDTDFEGHIVHLEKGEHASAAYQKIHPDGLVPAFVEDGKLIIESIDIISHLAANHPNLGEGDPTILDKADGAQKDLKLLTFEFLFRGAPPPPEDEIKAFENNHQNEWLKQFKRDFAAGFDRARVEGAVNRTAALFDELDQLLGDGRAYLDGDAFTLSDVAWIPNFHRFDLMGWPFDRTPNLQTWFDRMRQRPSYIQGLEAWEPDKPLEMFAAYTKQRQAEGTDICTFGVLAE